MRILIFLIILVGYSTGMSKGQTKPDDTTLILEKLYGRLVTNYADDDRLRINDSIRSFIESYVISDTIFDHNFSNLKYLGQITSRDSLLKIITWNLVLRSRPSQYFCYLIRKPESGLGNKVFSLSTHYNEEPVRTDTIYTEINWYGALYYDIRPFNLKDQRYWILLGIDYGNLLITRKIIEVLSFTREGSIIFGKKLFISENETRYRDVFDYASNGMMSLRFNSEDSIVFDHLVPFSPEMKNDRQFYGPDYSYDAYILENDLWKLIINVDARNKE